MNLDDIRNALGPPRGDKPRKVVICHPDIYQEVQRAVVHDLGHTDVLVKTNRYLAVDQAIVADAEALDFGGPFEGFPPLGPGEAQGGNDG